MEKNNGILIVEGKEGKLFQEIQRFKTDFPVERVDFLEAREAVVRASPRIVILNLDNQKEGAREILNTFSPTLRETFWAISAEEIAAEELVDFMRLGVTDFLKQPLKERALQDFIQRIDNLSVKRTPEQNREVHQVISFFSSKGGVGVSFSAVNFAVGIAKRNLGRVLLADLVLQHGNVADFLDVVPKFTLLDIAQNLERLDKKFLENSLQKHPSGIFILPRPKQPEEAECLSANEITQVLQFLKKSFNYVVLDVGHELNAITILCLDLSDLIFTVTTPDLPSLCNTKFALQTFKKLGYSQNKVKLILNRWHMKGEIETSVIEGNISYPISYKLMDDPSLALTSLNRGVPLAELSENSKLAKSFEELIYLVGNGARKGD